MTGFWLLTLIIQTPISCFLLVIVWIPLNEDNFQIVYQLPMQFALQAIHLLFILFENIFGLVSLKVLARYQIARFHYKQFDGSDGINENDDFKDIDWLHNLEKMNDFNMKTQDFQVNYKIILRNMFFFLSYNKYF